MSRGSRRFVAAGAILAATVIVVSLSGCRQKMADQPSYHPLEPSAFFEDGMSARQLVEGTVPRGHLEDDAHLYTGRVDGELVTTFPSEMTAAVIRRGRVRYDIYCSVCHGKSGYGNGMVVQRGYRQPPSFHTVDMRQKSVGHHFDVITNGFGAMPSYSHQVPAEDRWAIVAYIRALQLSQNARIGDVPRSQLEKLEE